MNKRETERYTIRSTGLVLSDCDTKVSVVTNLSLGGALLTTFEEIVPNLNNKFNIKIIHDNLSSGIMEAEILRKKSVYDLKTTKFEYGIKFLHEEDLIKSSIKSILPMI